ncbi:hypothetical protein SAMN05444920_101961 [Nonomuraea solani]|uniref:Excreted virulence factor EspC, type VII ESX diderm n=1 Tax=Nonomuraea solani TaxID=1144553 RepID=A0A1H5VRB2_9ACTN|nr:hypothetical protein [Nonomuraea solani]SEF89780.1 hypothetical protein SAMN05444920_101961 [Nonomuraea solani]
MNLWDGSYIAKPIVDRGISAWSLMAEDLERGLPKLTAQVEECLASAPWGGGAEGRAFFSAHFRDDGPSEMLSQCGRLTREIADAGTRLRKVIDNTVQTDLDIEHGIRTGMVREV